MYCVKSANKGVSYSGREKEKGGASEREGPCRAEPSGTELSRLGPSERRASAWRERKKKSPVADRAGERAGAHCAFARVAPLRLPCRVPPHGACSPAPNAGHSAAPAQCHGRKIKWPETQPPATH